MGVRFSGAIAAALLAGGLTFGASAGMAADLVSGLQPATPQPSTADLKPGLAVTYYFNEFDNTREIADWAKYRDGVRGEPILILDYFVGDGEVLTSGQNDHVGADIRGYLNFPVAGTYTIAMLSNDGVDLSIGGVRIVHDPDVHSDRFSDLVPVELYWLKPGGSGQLDFMPEESFAHIPGEAPKS